MKKVTKNLFGAAKIAHEKKVTAERKVKASKASMKSVQKRKANMTDEELKAWRKKQSEASMKSHKARLAAMTEEQLAEYKAVRNAKAKAWREAKKAAEAIINADQTATVLTDNEQQAEAV